MSSNSDIVIALDKERMDAMAASDTEKLQKTICKNLIYTHSSARLDTKDSLIGNMKSGATVYESVVPSEVKAQELGNNVVVLTGTAQISVHSGGKALKFGVRFTDVWENQGGQWRMVAWQSTKTTD